MSKKLVIVESPAKSKTLMKYLGSDYSVLASYGHVRDLPARKGSVVPDDDFLMKYDVIERNAKHVDAIAKAMKSADALYLATDPDREGEAISWHVYELLKERNVLKEKPVYRVAFYEITKNAVVDAIAHPREISIDLVNAQQARRALDYLVGFYLSPLLWKKIRKGLSAGRVQSPALRLIVEREEEIEKFKSQEYWTIEADCSDKSHEFQAKLIEYQNNKVEQFTITEEQQAHGVRDELIKQSKGRLTVTQIEKKQRKRNPAAPFITSTLQQEAARKLGFTTRRTMMVAQQLYEGVDIGTGTVGLITYMRTDSVNLSQDAITEIREFITERYGANNLPTEARIYKTKAKNAQEAHEAIRPTSVKQTPSLLKDYLSAEQFKLYEMIWKRTLASQMIHATIDTVAIHFSCGDGNTLRANGSTIAEPGFMTVYQEGVDDTKTDDEDGNLLPPLKKGDQVGLKQMRAEQHFTEPPPRYSEASLVKTLEEFGIGRPSTYAAIIHTLQQREYVLLDKKRFSPTDVGRIVNRFLTQHFTNYVDYDFTAHLEDELDAVSRGEKEWLDLLKKFWAPFNQQLHVIDESVARKDVTTEEIDELCPKCGKKLSIRLGRRGRFIGCTGYPECDYTSNVGESSQTPVETIEGRQCPDCQSTLIIRHGPYGKFIGCSNYPTCNHIEPLEKPADTGVECPECKKGSLLSRKSRRGKVFFSCSRYPDCSYAIWDQPIKEECPQCHWPILTLKVTKKAGEQKVCPRKECGYIDK